jgi:hypothetical protein
MRNNMWVMTPDGIGILFQYMIPVSKVHMVDEEDGTTFAEVAYSTSALRQAKYNEIPECRRGMDKKWFNRKGYV